MKFKQLLVVGALLVGQVQASERIVSYDLGSIDTVRALQATDQLVGVPKQTLPSYLSEFSATKFVDVGGLKTPDAKAVSEAAPSLIWITARQGEQGQALKTLAPVEVVSLSEGDYWPAFAQRVMNIAQHVDKQHEAEQALAALKVDLSGMKDAVAGQSVLMLTHNAGSFMLTSDPIASELLGLKRSALPQTVVPVTRGTRTFTPLTIEDIAWSSPKVLYIVDRSRAIGQTQDALDVAAFKTQLQALGAKTKVVTLDAGLWYLSGNGLESVRLQAQELVQALR